MTALVLASGSPRRYELLQLLDRPFTVVRPNIPEQRSARETPMGYVQRLAAQKAEAGARLAGDDAMVLGADTIVVCDHQVLEKPADENHFVTMMELLSGRSHQAITAIALHYQQRTRVTTALATVTFKSLTAEEIRAYWASGEPADKAGGYGIQGRAAKFVTKVEGSYLAVVGLPLYETEQLIRQAEGDANER
ncbi:septum formation inhibitor Maf [Pseudidiomarina salinarum]|uniref:dTTP/UTP pyrophosphatase n=1 Tax=Pseudidiomarina salinarum TaxID=435908 RepID=A0A094JF47_9GAMM|nr:Maf family protein [Pseudidiomarina salinarum]KFZ31186.1 septum formation inhibitor Maf [Pseudidiomarina salinarum]RUO71065.1 septum formation inhibitor Maf [Pseudidiomarina salinarum]